MPCRVGIGYRPALKTWLSSNPSSVDLVEITAEHFYKNGERLLERLGSRFPLCVHTERLSLATPGPLDERELEHLKALTARVDPLWVSDHFGFRQVGGVDLGYPVSVSWDAESARRIASRIRTAAKWLDAPLIVENVISFLQWDPASEPELLNRVCEEAGCGLLVDLSALLANCRNYGVDSAKWLAALDPGHVKQIHVGGLRRSEDAWLDSRDAPVDEESFALVRELVASAGPSLEAVVLERDEAFVSGEIELELKRIRGIVSELASTAVS